MDNFGIGQALISIMRAYFLGSRGTGRTTRLVDSLKAGDRVVCASQWDARDLERKCMMRGIKVEILVIDPRDARRITERGRAQGSTYLDHGWLEKYYLQLLDAGAREVSLIQDQASGWHKGNMPEWHACQNRMPDMDQALVEKLAQAFSTIPEGKGMDEMMETIMPGWSIKVRKP